MPPETGIAGGLPGFPQPAGKPPQMPPFGSSPMTGPTSNRGNEAQALQRLAVVIHDLEEIIPLVGSGSEAGKDILGALTKLGKHVQPGAVTPAAQRNVLQNAQLRNAQQAKMLQALKAGGGGPPGGAPGGGGPLSMGGGAGGMPHVPGAGMA
jgi:hypothetical protein